MPLVNCRECGKEVSHEADVCPSCGIKFPSKKRFQTRRYTQITILLLLLGFIGYTYYHFTKKENSSYATSKQTTDTVSIKDKIIAPDDKQIVKDMIDSGKSAMRISKETGLRLKEVRKIKKEKEEEEKHKN